MSGRSSAVVESMTRGSSSFNDAGMAGTEPVAIIALSNVRFWSPPLARFTLSVCARRLLGAGGGGVRVGRGRVERLGAAVDVLGFPAVREEAGPGGEAFDDD